MSFRPIATNIGFALAIAITITIAIAVANPIGNTATNANTIVNAFTATKKFEKTPSSRFKCAFKGFFMDITHK